MRNTEYEFVTTDSNEVLTQLIEMYEVLTGHTLQPADPDRLFISWVADVIIQERVNQNYVGNQNIPSRAVGDNLDALGKWIFNVERKSAQSAKCTVRFTLSEVQNTAIPIPKGTRVSDSSKNLVWDTTSDVLISAGSLYADAEVECETPGTIGNGYIAGQINTLIDVDNILFYSNCANTTTSDGGFDAEDDETYYEVLRASLDSYSTAGARGSYIYHAKSVSDKIADVKAILPTQTRTEELTVYTDGSSNKKAFIGGDQIVTSSLRVYAHGSTVATAVDTDYTFTYTNGLLTISIVSDGALDSETTIDISFTQDKAGNVYIYALMDDGTIATETIKSAIAAACNADSVRPITDVVTVMDPQYVNYSISCTYYIDRNTTLSVSTIEAAVTAAVSKYQSWQKGKLGRDINPSKLQSMLMVDGVKRVSITSPAYTELSNGDDGSTPQIASVTTVTVTNGGYEDE